MKARFPALDGIRALAVAGVLAYHAGVVGVHGGLLGVDVFFVLSGFLITTLLVRERESTGRIGLGRFWGRRARRLLPALVITVVGVALYARFVPGADPYQQLRGDAFSTLLYFANWHYIAAGQSYFVHYGAPSPLLHTWSLAVEEQFYVLWPLLAMLAFRRGGRRALGWVAGGGVVASAGATALLSVTGAGASRLYYGTDVRAQELMVGCLLALVVPALVDPALVDRLRGGRLARSAVGISGLAGAAFLGWAFHQVDGQSSFLYRGGFLLVALSTAALVALGVSQPRSVAARLLSLPPIRYVGRISYGLYLYHWPLFLLLDHAHTGLLGPQLLVVRLAATLALASLSFHLVEEPIRSGRMLKGRPAVLVAPLAALTTAGSLVVATTAAAAPIGGSVPTGTTAQTHRVLSAAAATAGPPPGTPVVNMLLLGDSIGLTFGEGLETSSVNWGVSVDDQGDIGCDLDPSSTVNIMGQVTAAAQGCAHWQSDWSYMIGRANPDVVGILLGRWEVSDRLVNGRWVTVGDPSWDSRLSALLDQAVSVVSAEGAKVVFFTLPYVQQNTEQPDGSPWPINLPARTDAFNGLVEKVAAAHPGVASVIDLNRMLDPQGHYADVVDGVAVRSPDQEHISVAGGELVRPYVLPSVQQAGVAHARARQ